MSMKQVSISTMAVSNTLHILGFLVILLFQKSHQSRLSHETVYVAPKGGAVVSSICQTDNDNQSSQLPPHMSKFEQSRGEEHRKRNYNSKLVDVVVGGGAGEITYFDKSSIRYWKKLFKKIDSNNSGLLEYVEIRRYLQVYFGKFFKCNKTKVFISKELASLFDSDFDFSWDIAEFSAFISSCENGTLREELEKYMEYDVEAKGFITTEQAKRAILDIYKNVADHINFTELNYDSLEPVDGRSLLDEKLLKIKLRAEDNNKDAKIQFSEFQELYRKEQKETEIALTFKMIDQNKNDKISRMEFIEAYSDPFSQEDSAIYNMQDEIYNYFKTFNMLSELHAMGEIENVIELLEEYQYNMIPKSSNNLAVVYGAIDTDKNGKVDYQEFRNYFVLSTALGKNVELLIAS